MAARGTLVVAQSVLAACAWRIGISTIAAWNLLFVAIDMCGCSRSCANGAVTLPGDLQAIHNRHFFALAPAEFLRL